VDTLYVALMQAPVAIGVVNRSSLVIEFANDLYLGLVELGSCCERDRLAAVFDSGRPLVDPELRVRGRGDDTDTYWTVTYSPLRDLTGGVESAIIVCHDVTAQVTRRKRAELVAGRLKSRLKDADAAVRRIETFTGMVAHDLRNPLAAMLLSAQASLTRTEHDEEVRSNLRRIVRAGTRMHGMIALLIDFTRVGLGLGLPLHRRTADLGEVVRQAVDELEVRYPHRLAVESVGDSEGDWDVERLLEVVSNLTTNALDHGAPGGPVALVVDGTDADYVELRVHNEGTIARRQLSSIFDAFHRGTALEDGLGLGLFIAKQIAVAHGGDIQVESSKTSGTQFSVRLPRRALPDTGSVKHAAALPAAEFFHPQIPRARRSRRDASA
jgi:signal transduction histidine kinase